MWRCRALAGCFKERGYKMLVRNLLEKYPDSAFHMMTPGGFVDLSPEQARELLKGESVKAHPGVSGCDMEMDAEELLNERVDTMCQSRRDRGRNPMDCGNWKKTWKTKGN